MIVINFPNGDKFHLDPKFVAESRADYMGIYEGFDRDSKEWNDEFEYSMKYELLNWLSNNMSWEDIKDNVTKVEYQEIDYNEFFNNKKAKIKI